MYNKEELKSRYTGVSASFLNWFDISPLYAYQKLHKIIDEKPTKEQELGIQLHMYVLEQDKFSNTYLYKSFDAPRGEKQKEFCELCANMKTTNPEFKALDIAIPCYKATYNTEKKSDEKVKEESLSMYKLFLKYIKYLEIQNNYKGTIDQNSMRYIQQATKVIKEHCSASKLLFDDQNDIISNDELFIQNEFELYWEESSILLNNKPLVIKSIIDRFIIDFENKEIYLIDLKTSKYLYEFKDKFKEHKYDRQLALYWKAIKYYFTQEYPDLDISNFKLFTRIVAVQTPNIYRILPVECKVVKIKDNTLEEGIQELNDSLQNVAWHFENDYWEKTREAFNQKEYDIEI